MSEDKAYDMWKELEASKAENDRLRAENAKLVRVLKSTLILPKPWIKGASVSWPDWDATFQVIEAILAEDERGATLGNTKPVPAPPSHGHEAQFTQAKPAEE